MFGDHALPGCPLPTPLDLPSRVAWFSYVGLNQMNTAAKIGNSNAWGLPMVDGVGATVSFACAVHCVAMPLLLASLPLLGLGFLATRGFEAGMIGIAFMLALVSLTWGLRRHGR